MKDIEGIDRVLKLLEPHWPNIEADFERTNERMLKLLSVEAEPIGRVLRAHLVIETFMDDYLSEHYELENLQDLRLSFYQKAKLLPAKAAGPAVVRPGIFQLNAVRNKFGHSLDHAVDDQEITAIHEVLRISRAGQGFASPIEAIEAFTPVACAFLSLVPEHLKGLFAEAFSDVSGWVQQEEEAS